LVLNFRLFSEVLACLQTYLAPQIFEFIDENAGSVFSNSQYTQLPQHILRLIIAREELQVLTNTRVNMVIVQQ
jgi:hypothetical protein